MSINISDHLKNRQWMVAALASEIYGPGGRFKEWKNDLYAKTHEIKTEAEIIFSSWEEYERKRFVQHGTGEEILKDETPSKRYGVGLLFPDEEHNKAEALPSEKYTDDEALNALLSGMTSFSKDDSAEANKERKSIKDVIKKSFSANITAPDDSDEVESDEVDSLSLARMRRPQSMGITFVAESNAWPMEINIEGARYRPFPVKIKNKEDRKDSNRKMWLRVPIIATETMFQPAQDGRPNFIPIVLSDSTAHDNSSLILQLDVRIRSIPAYFDKYPPTAKLVTITLVNKTKASSESVDESTLFQARFRVAPSKNAPHSFLPLPHPLRMGDEEEGSLALLYRNTATFASGHGCAGDWEADEGQKYATAVIAEPIPMHETPPITPDLEYPSDHEKAGQELKIFMLPIAKQSKGWIDPLVEIVQLYDKWIRLNTAEINNLDPALQEAATRHMQAASACLKRIYKGLELLRNDQNAAYAFQLTNEAMLLQQIAGGQKIRKKEIIRGTINEGRRTQWSSEYKDTNLDDDRVINHGKWRPFQIAFLLMSIVGLWDGTDDDREIADLIWFPTGGGKTEAYLAASAFYLISRRLQSPNDLGTGVLMRYTLRLLTSQQFQRAASLICALERVRVREKNRLGSTPFSIGIWVGIGSTPNTRKDSLEAYKKTCNDGPKEYKHVLLKCPWCAAEMGPKKSYPGGYRCSGLAESGSGDNRHIRIHCPDKSCAFNEKLPVAVVDQEIYTNPPSLLIGTVDKFAMLAWKSEGRSIFGIDGDGKRKNMPPGLIIQDELHLITGPLGSMVGLYEGVIEELCSSKKLSGEITIKPKILASTATTRASSRQIRDLYAREHTAIFPPPGLDAGDSFFAKYDRDKTGKIKPGRLYLGILARAYGSALTVNVRVLSALLAAAYLVETNQRDPWSTLLVFYNALRELGSGLTLFGADIPDRLMELRNRWTPGAKRRYINNILELTGRLENSEVPRALEALEKSLNDGNMDVVDACLASNIIEVGVDVPRLGLMAVSGQPKNTAQYIQATGRVGRSLPGLVVMIYDNSKARDLSHYEQFRDYHSRIYAQVEPASVTPFTTQVLERALHGAFLVWIRNMLPTNEQSDPRNFFKENSVMRKALDSFCKVYEKRIDFLFSTDPSAKEHALNLFKNIIDRRKNEWACWTEEGASSCPVLWVNYDQTGASGDQPLLREYGKPFRDAWKDYSWPTPTSMRGVDAECPAEIWFNNDDGGNN